MNRCFQANSTFKTLLSVKMSFSLSVEAIEMVELLDQVAATLPSDDAGKGDAGKKMKAGIESNADKPEKKDQEKAVNISGEAANARRVAENPEPREWVNSNGTIVDGYQDGGVNWKSARKIFFILAVVTIVTVIISLVPFFIARSSSSCANRNCSRICTGEGGCHPVNNAFNYTQWL